MKKSEWIWMPHPGHFICARDCRFHLSTFVGGHIVSTVGEYEPDMAIREIEAKTRGIELKGMGDYRRADAMEKLGYNKLGFERTYETMVFKAEPAPKGADNACCPYRQASGHEVDMGSYNDAKSAFAGHMKLCLKWAKHWDCAKKRRPKSTARVDEGK